MLLVKVKVAFPRTTKLSSIGSWVKWGHAVSRPIAFKREIPFSNVAAGPDDPLRPALTSKVSPMPVTPSNGWPPVMSWEPREYLSIRISKKGERTSEFKRMKVKRQQRCSYSRDVESPRKLNLVVVDLGT